MSYVLGIDLGATRTKAAVSRPDAEPEAVALDGSSRWVDSVVHLDQDAAVSAGQNARAMVERDPDGVVSGFTAQVGDEVGVLLGGDRYSGEVLTAALAGWVTDRVASAERAEPDRIVLAHPPGWGAHRRAVLHDALADAGMPSMALVPAPIAAAHRHASRRPVDVGALLVVCRIGGERADGAVLRRTPDGFDLLAHVDGPRGAAGAALDDALAGWVREQVPDPPPPARLRSACVVAKERLSVNEEVVVPVGRHGVRLTRAEFDRLARPVLMPVLDRLRRLIDAAQGPRPVAVELVGGTARVPLLAELASAALGCPAAVDPDPATAICRGVVQVVAPHRVPGRELVTAGAARARERVPAEPPPRPPIELTPLEPPKRRRLQMPTRRRRDRSDGRLVRDGVVDEFLDVEPDRDEFLDPDAQGDWADERGRPRANGDPLDSGAPLAEADQSGWADGPAQDRSAGASGHHRPVRGGRPGGADGRGRFERSGRFGDSGAPLDGADQGDWADGPGRGDRSGRAEGRGPGERSGRDRLRDHDEPSDSGELLSGADHGGWAAEPGRDDLVARGESASSRGRRGRDDRAGGRGRGERSGRFGDSGAPLGGAEGPDRGDRSRRDDGRGRRARSGRDRLRDNGDLSDSGELVSGADHGGWAADEPVRKGRLGSVEERGRGGRSGRGRVRDGGEPSGGTGRGRRRERGDLRDSGDLLDHDRGDLDLSELRGHGREGA